MNKLTIPAASQALAASLLKCTGMLQDAVKTREELNSCESVLGFGGANLAYDLSKFTGSTVYEAAKSIREKALAGVPKNILRRYVNGLRPKDTTLFSDADVLQLGKLYTDSGMRKAYGVPFTAYIHAVGLAVTYLRKPTA